MKLTHEDRDQLTVLTVKGDLTHEHTEILRKVVADKLKSDIRDFVLDLKEAPFVDSAGLEAMIWLQDRCGEQLGQLRLAGVTENVEKILEMTRLLSRFDRHADVASAVKSLR